MYKWMKFHINPSKVVIISFIIFFSVLCLYMGKYPVRAEDSEDLSPLEYNQIAAERLQQAALLYGRWQENNEAELFQQAIIYAASAAEISPDWDEPWVLLGMLYSELKTDQQAMELAVEALLNAVEANPANARAQILLANALLEQGRFYSAIEQYKSLFAKNKSMINGTTITPFVMAYIADGRMEAGINYLNKLEELHPENMSIKIGLAVILKNNGQKKEALDILNMMIMDEYLLGYDNLSDQEEKYITSLKDNWEEEGGK